MNFVLQIHKPTFSKIVSPPYLSQYTIPYTGNSVFTARIQDTNHSGSFVTFQLSHKVCNKYTNISYHNLST